LAPISIAFSYFLKTYKLLEFPKFVLKTLCYQWLRSSRGENGPSIDQVGRGELPAAYPRRGSLIADQH
jgi:hypothetical protein